MLAVSVGFLSDGAGQVSLTVHDIDYMYTASNSDLLETNTSCL